MATSDLKVLDQLLTSTLTLLAQFAASLGPSHDDDSSTLTQPTPITNPPNPLNVLRDSATLLKAHTTKLSLLAINKPFTPTALTKVLREVSNTCLPAMMSAAQICTQERAVYGLFLRDEAHARVRRVFREMENLLREIQSLAAVEAGDSQSSSSSPPASSPPPPPASSPRKNPRPGARTRDSLASTGVVWESSDALIGLAAGGIAGLAVAKAEQWRETIRDAVEELREWREGTDLEAEGREDGLWDSEDEGVGGDDAGAVEDLFNAANSLPKDRVVLRDLAEKAEGRLRKVVLLYAALVKRRLKTWKAGEGGGGAVEGLDELMKILKRIPHLVDELVMTFYELDEEAVEGLLEKCVGEARKASEVAALSWKGEEDEFTTWSRKWKEAVG